MQVPLGGKKFGGVVVEPGDYDGLMETKTSCGEGER